MHRFIIWLARVTAILGGFVLMVLVAMTTLSIIGRTLSKMFHSDFALSSFGSLSHWIIDLGVGEINGNYELLEAGWPSPYSRSFRSVSFITNTRLLMFSHRACLPKRCAFCVPSGRWF